MSILRALVKRIIDPIPGYPLLSGFLMGAIAFIGVFFALWIGAWATHFCAEFFRWLPWPKN